MPRFLPASLCALVVLGGLPDVVAEEGTPAERAEAALVEGQRAFEVQRYAQAITAFQSAYLLDPRPEILYALGQAQRNAKDCVAAIESYTRFLRSAPPARSAEAARLNIQRCETELAARAAVASPRTLHGEQLPKEQGQLPRSAGSRSIPRWSGGLLLGLGSAAVIAGASLAGVGRARISALDDAQSYGDFAASRPGAEAAEAWQSSGVAVAAVGAALGVGGAVLLGIALRRQHGGAR